MKIIVQKFGGTSLGNIERIKSASLLIKAELIQKHKVVAVVSAMSGTTNALINYCHQISNLSTAKNMREYDAAISSGENITASLLALALQELEIDSQSMQAWQIPIRGSKSFASSLIEHINTDKILDLLNDGIVPIITGFQAIDLDGNLTTLGKGGSDTSAALIAAALSASRCDIYTDVDGIFSADPRIVHNAKKLSHITSEHMLEMSSFGAKVLHPRAALAASRYSLNMRVLSSFSESDVGTYIGNKSNISDQKMEKSEIIAISSNKNILEISMQINQEYFAELLDNLNKLFVSIDKIQQKEVDIIKFYSELQNQSKIESIISKFVQNNKIKTFATNTMIASVSVIGYALKNDYTILPKIYKILQNHDVPIISIEATENRITIILNDNYTESSIKILHEHLLN